MSNNPPFQRGQRSSKPWRVALTVAVVVSLNALLFSVAPATDGETTSESQAQQADARAVDPDQMQETDWRPKSTPAAREYFAYWIATAAEPWSVVQQGFGGRGRRSQTSYEVNSWDFDKQFESEAFRFVRIRFRDKGYRRAPGGKWYTDFPDCDLNFSFRLHQLTTLNVNPEPLYLDLTDPRIFEYPFLYMIEPGFIDLSQAEADAMREYLDRGGFIMVDDFWGEPQWFNFMTAMKQVFPDRTPIDLPLEHPIFHLVYDLPIKPQIPSIHNWSRYGVTWERSDAQEVHYRAFVDSDNRIQMMICHNTDLGDGWEREGESREYFELFSEKYAYPLGINIVVYAMTH